MDVSRNWGFVTAEEQERLGAVKVAVAGTGGEGGLVAEHLARLGVRRFALADPELFEAQNLNRQTGCDATTLGHKKAEVIAGIIRRISPAAEVAVYPEGIDAESVGEFVAGSDVIVDEIEYTRPHLSVLLARTARPSRIPVVSGLNVGFGAMVTTFLPGRMTLERYLGLPRGISLTEAEHFPLPLNSWVVRVPAYGDEAGLRLLMAGGVPTPSVVPGVALATGLVVTEVFNLVARRRRPVVAPRTLFIDALELKMRVVHLRRLAYYGSLARLVARSRLGLNPRVTPPEPRGAPDG